MTPPEHLHTFTEHLHTLDTRKDIKDTEGSYLPHEARRQRFTVSCCLSKAGRLATFVIPSAPVDVDLRLRSGRGLQTPTGGGGRGPAAAAPVAELFI